MAFSANEQIQAPRSLVWRHLSEPDLMQLWMPGISGMRARDLPLQNGSELIFVSRGAERAARIVDLIPAQQIAIRSTQGSFTAVYRYTLSGDDCDCSVALDAGCSASGAARLAAPLVNYLMRRADGGQLALLKAEVERHAKNVSA